jgi:gas vesicle protein
LKAGIAIFAGAAIGGAMMFLFDPKVGTMRRRRIGSAAQGAMDQGKDVLGSAIGAVASHAGQAAEHLRSHLSDAAEHLRNHLSDAAEDLRSHLSDASERAAGMAADTANSAKAAGSGLIRQATGGVKQYANDAQDRAMHLAERQLRRIGNALPHDREHHYVGQTTCAMGSLALGASAVYFFDPENGARRRADFRGRIFGTIRSAGDLFNAAGRRIRDRISSKMHGASSIFPSNEALNQGEAPMPEMGTPAAQPVGSQVG